MAMKAQASNFLIGIRQSFQPLNRDQLSLETSNTNGIKMNWLSPQSLGQRYQKTWLLYQSPHQILSKRRSLPHSLPILIKALPLLSPN
jgi:hypothetical protein